MCTFVANSSEYKQFILREICKALNPLDALLLCSIFDNEMYNQFGLHTNFKPNVWL